MCVDEQAGNFKSYGLSLRFRDTHTPDTFHMRFAPLYDLLRDNIVKNTKKGEKLWQNLYKNISLEHNVLKNVVKARLLIGNYIEFRSRFS